MIYIKIKRRNQKVKKNILINSKCQCKCHSCKSCSKKTLIKKEFQNEEKNKKNTTIKNEALSILENDQTEENDEDILALTDNQRIYFFHLLNRL